MILRGDAEDDDDGEAADRAAATEAAVVSVAESLDVTVTSEAADDDGEIQPIIEDDTA